MNNYKFTISYDGTRYFGWEHQPGTDMTIQGKIENVLMRMTEAEQVPEVICSGRTDAGVHAKAMIANARLNTVLSPAEIKKYMNRYLPDDICITDVVIAGDRFHSRYNATGKTYRYTCYAGDLKPVFDRKYVTVLEQIPDIAAMRQAAGLLKGEHDFAGFCSNPKMKKSTVRTIDSISITNKGSYIYFTYHGNGFLQHMVRIITGTLLEIGMHKRNIESITDILSSGNRSLAGYTAPASGLCLIQVDYN